jgi:hypothetical protein
MVFDSGTHAHGTQPLRRPKIAREHCYDNVTAVVKRQRPTDNAGIAAKPGLPELVAEKHDMVVPGLLA